MQVLRIARTLHPTEAARAQAFAKQRRKTAAEGAIKAAAEEAAAAAGEAKA